MTDRELLEAAAKAAGYTGTWGGIENIGPDEIDFSDMFFLDRDNGDGYWDPLTDDGDALRLAAALGIDFYWHADGLAVARLVPGDLCEEWFAANNNDKSAAARRAIVRAAAAEGAPNE